MFNCNIHAFIFTYGEKAIYRADEWEYERLSGKWYNDLIFQMSAEKSMRVLQEKHPIEAIDSTFTRPLIPFDCTIKGYYNSVAL